MKWLVQMPWCFVFWVLNFKAAFSLSSFILIKWFFSSSSHSAICVVSSAYLKLLIFLLTILIPVCNSSRLAFHMMYSVYKLNKEGDNTLPYHTPFPILNQSTVLCPVLIVASSAIFVRTLHYDPFILGGPAQHDSQLHWVIQAPLPRSINYDPWKDDWIWDGTKESK